MALAARGQLRKSTSVEKGQAVLEILPVALLLLTLAFAVIDFSRAIWQLEVMSALTREGSNLASRGTTLPAAAATVLNDGVNLNLAGSGEVIVTSVANIGGGVFVITGQTPPNGALTASSKIGNGVGSAAILPATSPTIPQPNQTIYITEVFSSFAPITPLGAFLKITLPTTLYDVAYF
jgi:Flp pilus assembly protein TadG